MQNTTSSEFNFPYSALHIATILVLLRPENAEIQPVYVDAIRLTVMAWGLVAIIMLSSYVIHVG